MSRAWKCSCNRQGLSCHWITPTTLRGRFRGKLDIEGFEREPSSKFTKNGNCSKKLKIYIADAVALARYVEGDLPRGPTKHFKRQIRDLLTSSFQMS